MITLTREEAQQVLDALECMNEGAFNAEIKLLRARLAQPEPDFDWKDMYEKEKRRREMWTAKYEKDIRKLERAVPTAQPEPEPVAWTVGGLITDFSRDFSAYKTKTYTRPLYTAPPQREWQGLTDEEVMSLLPGAVRLPPGWVDTVRAIEAKLKEKNNG